MWSVKKRMEIVTKYFASLFGAVSFQEKGEDADNNFSKGSSSIKVDIFKKDEGSYYINRAINFTQEEQEIIKSISKEMRQLFAQNLLPHYANICLPQAQLLGISKAISPSNYKTVLTVLNILEEFSTQTYEGQRITFSVGIDETITSMGNNLSDVCRYYFSRVLTSDCNSLLVCSRHGGIVGHFSPVNNCDMEDYFAPLEYLPIASWSSQGKYVFCLNGNGEILVFKNRCLVFAKRRGQWCYFPHQIYTSTFNPAPILLKVLDVTEVPFEIFKSIYVSVIDASFRRKGACIGVIKKSAVYNGDYIMDCMDFVSESDILEKRKDEKTRLLNSIVGSKKFNELSRQLRQEILAMDGATIIFEDGTIFAVGAILKINCGSSGGGRRAAACTLSKYGVGIKVSSDGKITIWYDPDRTDYFEEIG